MDVGGDGVQDQVSGGPNLVIENRDVGLGSKCRQLMAIEKEK